VLPPTSAIAEGGPSNKRTWITEGATRSSVFFSLSVAVASGLRPKACI
jgi:hypothetical protein